MPIRSLSSGTRETGSNQFPVFPFIKSSCGSDTMWSQRSDPVIRRSSLAKMSATSRLLLNIDFLNKYFYLFMNHPCACRNDAINVIFFFDEWAKWKISRSAGVLMSKTLVSPVFTSNSAKINATITISAPPSVYRRYHWSCRSGSANLDWSIFSAPFAMIRQKCASNSR